MNIIDDEPRASIVENLVGRGQKKFVILPGQHGALQGQEIEPITDKLVGNNLAKLKTSCVPLG
ncbi:hypothetical protein J2D73_05790 [Acetobacter sacchari]|uniref:Uncharacterized protein n=1 Tax=Acetobacter sacchari TaxID=2661687 RepID=A0ABS3LTS9_9PROT|nr:hypothetical protein [Acetobacter sacchari]MBO1359307.1 hypothetical protein [Acetobacter sacchari]